MLGSREGKRIKRTTWFFLSFFLCTRTPSGRRTCACTEKGSGLMLGRTRAREHHIACAFLLWAHVSFQLGTRFEAMQRLHPRGPHGHGTQVQSRWLKKVKPMQIWATFLFMGNMGDITEGRAGSVGTPTSRDTTTCNGMVWDVLSKRKPAAPFLVGLKFFIIVALEALVVNILAPPPVYRPLRRVGWASCGRLTSHSRNNCPTCLVRWLPIVHVRLQPSRFARNNCSCST